ncbi:MAG: GNAT family N-acetyltransferase [Actinomycetes bacterium]
MPTVRPDLSLLAVDDVGAVGLALNSVKIDKEPCGYVGTLGVVRRARGQGLGKALLHESFRRFRATGWHQAKLHVQVGNRTGADRLYRRVGMSSGTVDECWSLPLAAVR